MKYYVNFTPFSLYSAEKFAIIDKERKQNV